ncbi:MAG: His-Xaa-Ser system radical SAM maturase HxsC [Acidaminococcaceae bacterium]|nr:His-Xaa-Ser system radical SAM maturase HxsC [Acidaminococcaceae bacterium]
MITSKGVSHGFVNSKILRIEKNSGLNFFSRDGIIISEGDDNSYLAKYVLSTSKSIKSYQAGISSLDKSFVKSLCVGDIISIGEDGRVNLLWKCGQDDNLLFVTDFCNSKCIMCPQTKIEKPQNYYKEATRIIELAKDKPKYLCISGGEPTFLKEEYIKIVSLIQKKYPHVSLQVLTNGKNFSDFQFSKQCVLNSPVDTLYAIPIHSGNSALHDKIVRTKNSFVLTIQGIINLYKLKQNIEIRIVITKQNYKDLPNIAHFIYWNMPFVFHVAFMGMETHGSAHDNIEDIWIEPNEYIAYLEESVSFLNNRMLNVSVYNLPHCILSESLRKFAKDSISAWKKVFLEPCRQCSMVEVCSGVFATSSRNPQGIHRI